MAMNLIISLLTMIHQHQLEYSPNLGIIVGVNLVRIEVNIPIVTTNTKSIAHYVLPNTHPLCKRVPPLSWIGANHSLFHWSNTSTKSPPRRAWNPSFGPPLILPLQNPSNDDTLISGEKPYFLNWGKEKWNWVQWGRK